MENLDNKIIINKEEEGTQLIDILLDKSLVNSVKNKGKLDIKETEGIIKETLIEKLSRKNIIYYGKMIGEQPVSIEHANACFQAPLINTEQLTKRLEKVKKTDRNKIGYIHIGVIQIVLKSCFSEGISTPVNIKIIDNRIKMDNYKLIGEIDGDLGYGVIKFKVSLQFGIPITTKNFNNCLGVICEFKNKKLMEKGDQPFTVSYSISYALTNSNLSIMFKDQEKIYTDKLFLETSTFIKENNIQRNFLKNHSRRISFGITESLKNNLIENGEASSSNSTYIPEPLNIQTLCQKEKESRKLSRQIAELNNVVKALDKRI